jgi:uncharacterized membrane protein YtjA (UPF0391 family)
MVEGTKPGWFTLWFQVRGTVRQADGDHDMPGNLIYYALVLIVVAIAAALLGFGGVASTAMSGAHLFIWVAVVILIVGAVVAVMRRT